MKKILLLSFFVPVVFCQLPAQISAGQIDSVAERAIKTFDVPGIAVAVVKDGKVIHNRGYGVTSLNTKTKVNEHTRFAIASNSKAFTAASLAMLADAGKIKWTTLVTDIIPEFKLYAPYVTENFTIEDLLCHRSGLGLGAGDLMFWPGKPHFTRSEVIHNLRYLKPVSPFRTKYDYDNLLYMVAGEVVARVSGKPWEDFVTDNIFTPLGMEESGATFSRLKNKNNVIDPHAPVDGKVQVIPREVNEVLNAAGGIYSSTYDLSKWAVAQMHNGKYGNNLRKQLFSEQVHNDMWTIHTVIPVSGSTTYNTRFSGYGLGWRIQDEMGYKVVSHTGGLAGMVSQVTLIPELQLGIIVLTNQQSGAAFRSVTNVIKDAYFNIRGKDRIKDALDVVVRAREEADSIAGQIDKVLDSAPDANFDLKKFEGIYRDAWFGDIAISMRDGKLYFESEKSSLLKGPLSFYKESTFVVKWEYRNMDADAFINFGFDFDGNPDAATMRPVSPLTDFSFDFQDLDFKRVR